MNNTQRAEYWLPISRSSSGGCLPPLSCQTVGQVGRCSPLPTRFVSAVDPCCAGTSADQNVSRLNFDRWLRLNSWRLLGPQDRGLHCIEWLDPFRIGKSNTPGQLPCENLDLLWIICGQGKTSYYYRLADIIDQLLEAVPNLKNDRRLQWLELLAERFCWT